MRKYLIALFFCLIAGPAWAQCNGVFGPNQLCGTGASSGIPTAQLPPLTMAQGGTGVLSFTANLPLIGNGSGAIAQGTRSGSTTSFATTTGTLTNGHCVQFDGSGNLIDAGGACTTGGGGGTVSSASQYNIGYYATAGTVISGNTTITTDASNDLIAPVHAGGSATSSTLTLESTTGAGATDIIKFKTGSQIERLRIDNGGFITIGGFANVFGTILETIQTGGSDFDAGSLTYGASPTAGGWAWMITAGSTPSTQAVVGNGVEINGITALTSDGSTFHTSAFIGAYTDAASSAGSTPGRWILSTTPSGSTSATERMRIDSSGFVTLGGLANQLSYQIENYATNTVATGGGYAQIGFGNNASSLGFSMYKTRGATATAQTALHNNDTIDGINWFGSDGSAFQAGAALLAAVDAAPTSGHVPGRLVFATSSGSASNVERMRIDRNGNVGIGATSIQAPFEVRSTTQNIMAISGTNSSATRTIAIDTTGNDINTNIGAAINFVDDGADGAYVQFSTHTGSLGTTQSPTANFFTNGLAQEKVFRQQADLNMWGTLSCSVGSPSSSGVAQAAVNAYNAGWRSFFIPAGCFIYTGDSPWVGAFGSNTMPSGTRWEGEDWETSGISVCSTYTGCTPLVATTISGAGLIFLKNLFTMDGSCYNVDSGSFGHPSRCPLQFTYISSGTFGVGAAHPGEAVTINVGAKTNGTWNGTDQPGLAINQETDGDVIFSNNIATNTADNFINFFNTHGAVIVAHLDGKTALGTASTVHSGNGILHVIDASFGPCDYFIGNTTWTCSSDARLKTDIVDAGDQLAWLNDFRIRDYTWKSTGLRRTGVVAQDVLATHPEMVHEGGDGMLEVDGPSEWKLIKAMQQMQAEIVELQRKVH